MLETGLGLLAVQKFHKQGEAAQRRSGDDFLSGTKGKILVLKDFGPHSHLRMVQKAFFSLEKNRGAVCSTFVFAKIVLRNYL